MDIASKLIIENGALSVQRTPAGLRFDKSVLFCPSFYHAMNETDDTKNKKENLKYVDLFEIPINFYSNHLINNRFLWCLKIRHYKMFYNKFVLSVK